MEKDLVKFLEKKYGVWESAKVVSDNGKTIAIWLDFGDDESGTVTINRRKGYNGNYRVICSSL